MNRTTLLVAATGIASLLSLAAWAAKPEATPGQTKAVEMPADMETHTLVLLRRGPKAAQFTEAELEKLQERHLAHLGKLVEEGKILAVGPFADQTDEMFRGGCLYSVPVAEAVRLAEADPMVKAGRLEVTAMTWWMGKGYLAFPKKK